MMELYLAKLKPFSFKEITSQLHRQIKLLNSHWSGPSSHFRETCKKAVLCQPGKPVDTNRISGNFQCASWCFWRKEGTVAAESSYLGVESTDDLTFVEWTCLIYSRPSRFTNWAL